MTHEEKLGLEELEIDDELDMYDVHKDQVQWKDRLVNSGHNFTPIKPPTMVRVIDESSSPKRTSLRSMEELKSMKSSGLWVVRAEGYEENYWTVNVSMKGKR